MKKLTFINILLVLTMVVSMLPFNTLTAAAADGEGISKSKTSSEYELSEGKDTTEITLSLPSEEYEDTFDIVFVVDSSNESADMEGPAIELMADLLEHEDLKVRIGVIKFKGLPWDTIEYESGLVGKNYKGLTELNDDTKQIIIDAISVDPDDHKDLAGNGTNTPSSLRKAREWLDASKTPDDHKYVLLFTDGRSWVFDDGNGGPACIYQQFHRGNANSIQNSGKPMASSVQQYNKYNEYGRNNYRNKVTDENFNDAYLDKYLIFGKFNCSGKDYCGEKEGTAEKGSAAEFMDLYDYKNAFKNDPVKLALLEKELDGVSPYETVCTYVTTGNSVMESTMDPQPIANAGNFTSSYPNVTGTYWHVASSAGPFLEFSPFVIKNENGVYNYQKELNENSFLFHVSSQEKSLYQTAHYWKDLKDDYYAIAVINKKRACEAGYETTCDFFPWLAESENSDLAASVGSYPIPGIPDQSSISDVFDTLVNQIVYLVNKAVVTDKVPSYLDLVENAYDGIPFKLTVDGKALKPVKIAKNDWGFGDKTADGEYSYEVKWDPSSRTFKFYINVKVENAHPVQLKYTLKWNGKGKKKVDVDTNESTTIEYCSSDDETCENMKTEDYVSPVVIYKPTPAPKPEPTPVPEDDEPICCCLPRTGMGLPRSQKPASVNYRPAHMDLLIPSLDLNSRIVTVEAVNGEYPVDWLGADAGLLADTAIPGKGVSVLAGHSTLNSDDFGPFIGIGRMEEGDMIFVRENNGKLLTFMVYANEKIGANDVRALNRIAGRYDSTITLLTCEDEMASGGYASRRVIAAKQVD